MADKARAKMKVFGESGGTSEFGKFGSDAAGLAVTTKDLATIQSGTEYSRGWFGATPSQEPPRRQDRNGLDYLFGYQIAYLMEKGIPEWLNDSETYYYANKSYVSRNGAIYMAILGDDSTNLNTQKDPETNPLWWTLVYAPPVVDAWDSTESVVYEDAGVVIERFGKHFTSTGLAGNTNKDPINPANINYWYPSPGIDKLIDQFVKGEIIQGGMHKVNDLGDGDYSTSLLLDKADFGGTTYEFYRVALDGSVITSDSTLEGIFNTVSGTIYPHIDIFGPDSLGTRTLIDSRGRTVRSMTTGGGEADTLGEVQEDAMQRITGSITTINSVGTPIDGITAQLSGVFSVGEYQPSGTSQRAATASATDRNAMDFDSADSTSPSTAKTNDAETRMANIVEGIKYIIVMKAA